jgi:hypothetical protein
VDPTINPAYVAFAAIAPLLIALIKQEGFSTQVNAIIATLCYAIVGVAGALVTGATADPQHLVAFITTAAVVGTAAYNLIWSNIGVTPTTQQGPDGKPLSIEKRIVRATSLIRAA